MLGDALGDSRSQSGRPSRIAGSPVLLVMSPARQTRHSDAVVRHTVVDVEAIGPSQIVAAINARGKHDIVDCPVKFQWAFGTSAGSGERKMIWFGVSLESTITPAE